MPVIDRNIASSYANRRWAKPENVDQRVDQLAARIRAKVDQLPPLTPAQRDRLAAALRRPAPER